MGHAGGQLRGGKPTHSGPSRELTVVQRAARSWLGVLDQVGDAIGLERAEGNWMYNESGKGRKLLYLAATGVAVLALPVVAVGALVTLRR